MHTESGKYTGLSYTIPSLLACSGEGDDRMTTKVLSSCPRINAARPMIRLYITYETLLHIN